MFVNIIAFPSVKAGKDKEFRVWFEWSNGVYAGFNGFISRRLLEPTESEGYVGVVEHETKETFMAMHLSAERQSAWAKVEPLLEGSPVPKFYNVVVELKKK